MMIIALDDEELLLWRLVKELQKVFPDAQVKSFDTASECVSFLESPEAAGERVDYAFLDIQLGNASGFEVAGLLREKNAQVKIIFCTAYPEYSMDAFRVYANGYLLKPIKADQIRKLLRTLEPVREREQPEVYIHTFGNFDVFLDGKVMVFSRSKAKELLAYLVDRKGASVSSAEIAAVLWDDGKDTDTMKDRVQHVKKELRDTLSRYGIEELLISGWNSLAVNKTRFRCDYYDFLNGDPQAIQSYLGEYMSNYSWAEETAGALSFSQ